MNDKETILEMLRRAKIPFTRHQHEEGLDDSIQVEGGYWGFFAEFRFEDKTGALLSIKSYE